MFIFGGLVNTKTDVIRNNDSTPLNWVLNNFNDFGMSFVTLFELMVVNNWMITTEMYV
jgi:hypothetical protein